ncbi:hypothetical protein [Streptomyces sp. MST-110588]|uniref:hypothetical protein n=1 Tax=Streptomyces sp. MST-110588 TaxID=2833628 RepID=UPI001F5C9CC9|nr:hypothetical protein [Streptomyces sp. MST-110588]UNO42996.1 hypothetical protein KGS77_30200 [Streptomyces sp. MST-110588]
MATATLVSAPLLGMASPAMADGNQKPKVEENIFEKEEDIQASLQRWAPVADTETSMGYPKLEDQDITLADAKKVYDPDQALKDAVAAAQKYADNSGNSEPLRESAKKLVNGWPDAGRPQSPDIRKNTKDTDVGGQNAQQYCNMKNTDPQHSAFGQAAPCLFVGKIADAKDKYPVKKNGGAVAGAEELIRKVSASVTDEKTETTGWQLGGKISPKIGDGKSDIGGEVNFTYNYASTYSRKVTGTDETSIKVVPEGTKQASIEARGNGAVYTGYIVVRGPIENGQRLIAIPAKAFIQSPATGQPVTWFKRMTP